MKDKRTAIMESAVRLFGTQGLSVPTAKIAAEAGVANGTLFNHFPTKQDLQDQLYLELKTELASRISWEAAEDDLHGMLLTLWTRYAHWAVAYPDKHQVLHLLKAAQAVSPEVLAVLEAKAQPLHSAILQGMKDGRLCELDAETFQTVTQSFLDAAVSLAQRRELVDEALDGHIECLFGLFWKAVRA